MIILQKRVPSLGNKIMYWSCVFYCVLRLCFTLVFYYESYRFDIFVPDWTNYTCTSNCNKWATEPQSKIWHISATILYFLYYWSELQCLSSVFLIQHTKKYLPSFYLKVHISVLLCVCCMSDREKTVSKYFPRHDHSSK